MNLFEVFIVPLCITIIGVLFEVFLNWRITIIGRKKEKPRFFVNELLFNGVSSNNGNNYRFVGRLVGTWQHNNYKSHDLLFRINNDCKWESLECRKYTMGSDGEWKVEESEEITESKKSVERTAKIEMGNSLSYSIIGSYYTPIPSFPIQIVSKTIDNGDNNVELIKCPNISKFWLYFYIIFSSLVLFLISSIFWICRNNHILVDTTISLKYVYALVGLFFLFIAVFSFIVIWRALKSYRIVSEMKKYGIPYKKHKVTDKNLIRKMLEYMTGTETIDNIV